MLSREDIQEIIPHRNEMLLVDEAEKLNDTQAVGFYTVKGDEWFIRGHFPGHPVVPGVILCEMIAQTCCVIILGKGNTKIPYYAGIKNARFLSAVTPGDTVQFDCTLNKQKPPFYFVSAVGSVNGKPCVSGEFTFALMDGAEVA